MSNSSTLVQALLAAFCSILCALSSLGGGGMNLASRTGAWTKSGAPLPYDAEVEYLESTGTQWIDIGYTKSQCPYFSLDIQPLITNVDSAMFGAYTDGHSVQQYLGRWRWFDNGWTLTDIPVDITRTTNITKNANGWFVDGEITKTSSGLIGNLSLVLFGININSVKSGAKPIRVNQLSLFDKNSILVADFIPIRKGNIGYMYDRVSGHLYRNAGTGAFVIGPDKTT